jgi:hypothetical protein
VAWPESALPLDSDGESADPDELLPDESLLLLLVVVVLVVVDVDSACAAAPAARIPAALTIASPAVIAVVRRRPVFRSIDRLP